MLNCNCKFNCVGLAVIASIIVGIVTAMLRITAVITVTPDFLWVLFGIAVVYLAVLLLASAAMRGYTNRGCVCGNLPAIITGILGTVLTSVILLAITFAATSIIGAIITGALLFFFSLILTATACLVKCIAGCSDNG